MRALATLSCGLLAACGPRSVEMPDVDINAAAATAQVDIDAYAANRASAARGGDALMPASAVRVTPPSAAPVVAAAAVPAEPSAASDAAAARDTVRRYYMALGAGRYRDAYRFWDAGGAASGQTLAQFAADAEVDAEGMGARPAEVGAAGRIDAGAGQRYVEVPVRLPAGSAAGPAQAGTVTLHRTAAIDGATADQRRWHITVVSLTPVADDCRTERRVSERDTADRVWRQDDACAPPAQPRSGQRSTGS